MQELRSGRNVHISYTENINSDAPLAFFIHGAGGRSDQYRDIIPSFVDTYSVLTFDFVGHGKSEKPFLGFEYYKAEEILEDIASVFNQYRKEKATNILIGHSYGSALATLLFSSMKEHIHALILIGTCKELPGSARHPIWYLPVWALEWIRPMMREPFLQKAYHTKSRNEKQELLDYENSFGDTNHMHVMKNLTWGMKWPTTEDFSAICCPCLLVGGEEDQITPVSELNSVQACILNSELVIIPDTAHLPMLENPKITIEQISKFLHSNSLPTIAEI